MLLRLLPRHHALYYAPSINYTIAWSYMIRHANGQVEGSLDLPFYIVPQRFYGTLESMWLLLSEISDCMKLLLLSKRAIPSEQSLTSAMSISSLIGRFQFMWGFGSGETVTASSSQREMPPEINRELVKVREHDKAKQVASSSGLFQGKVPCLKLEQSSTAPPLLSWVCSWLPILRTSLAAPQCLSVKGKQTSSSSDFCTHLKLEHLG